MDKELLKLAVELAAAQVKQMQSFPRMTLVKLIM